MRMMDFGRQICRSILKRALNEIIDNVKVEGLDNRMVFVRREAVSDVYFSSEAYDDYGPEADRYQEPAGIFPDDDFWCVAEVFDELSDFEGEFDPEVLAGAKAKLTLTDAELDGLIAARTGET